MSRLEGFDPTLAEDLLQPGEPVFEYWGHAASYLPMSDFRFCLPRMRRFRDPEQKWVGAVAGTGP